MMASNAGRIEVARSLIVRHGLELDPWVAFETTDYLIVAGMKSPKLRSPCVRRPSAVSPLFNF